MTSPRRSNSANILLVLVVSTLAFLMVSLTAGLYLNQMSLAQGSTQRSLAKSAAESITNRVLVEFQQDPELGLPTHSRYSEVFRWKAADGSEGLITFDPKKAKELGIAVSTNNFEGEDPIPGGTDALVAPGTIELLGHGTADNQTQVVRHLAHVPPFAFVLATNGSFKSEGRLLVGQIPEGVDATKIELDDLLPGHLGAGADVEIVGEATVVGNVQGGSKVTFEGAIDVRGEVYRRRPMPEIPKVDIEKYDLQMASARRFPRSEVGGVKLEDRTRVDSDLLVKRDLIIENTILFVDGDLTVDGVTRGVGAIICTGDVTFNNAASLKSHDKIAVIAKGNVSMKGQGDNSLFRGMVYTEGNFFADNLTIIGNFISNKEHPDNDEQIKLRDVKLMQQDVAFRLRERRWLRYECTLVECKPVGESQYEFRARANKRITGPVLATVTTDLNTIASGNFDQLFNPLYQAHRTYKKAGKHKKHFRHALSVLYNEVVKDETQEDRRVDFDFNEFLNPRTRVRTLYLGAM